MKVTYVCSNCGGSNVVRDAWAEWDPVRQEWILQSTFDESYCYDCEGEHSLKEIPLEQNDG